MRKTIIKAGSLTLALCLTAASLAACSKGSETTESAGQPGQAKPPAAPKEPVELVFYAINGDSEESFNFRFGDMIRKKFPDYTIKYIFNQKGMTLQDLVTSGTRFDITYHAVGFYENFLTPLGLLYDMTDLMKAQKVDVSRFESTTIDAIKQLSGGKMYSLPVYGNNLVLYYNKSIFDKFGVAYPTSNMTWNQMSETAKKLTREDGGVQYYGFGMNPQLVTRMNPLSIPNADLASNSPTINKNDLWKQFFQTFFLDPQSSPGSLKTIPDSNTFLKEKNVAMMAYISSAISISGDQFRQVDWDLVPLPSFSDKPGVGSQINSINFGITSIAKNKEAAMEVLAYMTSDEFQTSLAKKGIMPVLKSDAVRNAIGQESEFKAKNFKAILQNAPAPIPPKALYDAELVNIYAKYGTQIWQGAVDINTAMRQAEEESKKKIEEYLNQNKK
ncbi:ABC transporter substrate-binding protein [Paenibacillus ginsengarvi]|uniref:Extracellular solute-binding protein n=1 Tax=Paenibacillus ginsengarvi TaxID=400777 RepID=A0A3B0CDJ9_9BACL|nr:extracellular solute-binding protein [Paenibacillus ginsengarvi]RKN83923.1 extracellular solute-binding protein [Paenibacillus ginsengarvi]